MSDKGRDLADYLADILSSVTEIDEFVDGMS
jgi:uncharacterized protein with HEPN domain